MTFDIDPGMIFSAWFPFSDLSKEKKRPVLALSEIDENGDVRVAFITKTPVGNKQGFALQATDFETEPLKHQSYLRVDKTFNLNISRIEKPVAQLNEKTYEKVLRKLIALDIPNFAKVKYKDKPFIPNKSVIPPSGKVMGETELQYMVEASLDGWLTTGRFNDQFEKELAEFIGVKHLISVNSGSSANLVAFATLTSPKLGARAIQKGDEVIAVAAGFPTTVNPIVQYGAIPVFVDVDLKTHNIDADLIEAAISPKTKAIMLAHTLGNPFNLAKVKAICEKHKLWLIEDCCDALGTLYTPTVDLEGTSGKIIAAQSTQHVGTFGDIATLSFYPVHHITMGEGGALFTNNGKLRQIIESFRDWGRDCFCPPGKDNTCKKRYCYQRGELPTGYDHKYTYSHTGYNLKITDMQAAVGVAQLEKLPEFIKTRKANYLQLRKGLKQLSDYIILPEETDNSETSWFGFPITLKQHKRNDLIAFLDAKKIASRLLFGGNLTKQPYFKELDYRIANNLENTDKVMNNTLWLGVYPGLNEVMLDYMISALNEFFIGNK